jgi:glutamyl-tRNA reductase
VEELKVIALTHKNLGLEDIGKFHLADDERETRLQEIKEKFGFDELMFLSTCNRVEIVISVNRFYCMGQARELLQELSSDVHPDFLQRIVHKVELFSGRAALEHLIKVASSLDSMVIGEREIITQVRKAFEESRQFGISGDLCRLVIKQTIASAKRIYTDTHIARKPVSVVSLAWQRILSKRLSKDSRVLLIGAGQIIRNMSRFLQKGKFENVTVANRTLQRAESIAELFENGKAISLEDLNSYTEGFDLMITCTGSDEAVITERIYDQLTHGEEKHKIIFDLALPADVDPALANEHDIDYTGMPQLKMVADKNIAERSKEIERCEQLVQEGMAEFDKMHEQRQIELAMRDIPRAIKEIRETAIGEVFAKDLEGLDSESREVLEKIMGYMEKKYISVPMKMAKQVILESKGRS